MRSTRENRVTLGACLIGLTIACKTSPDRLRESGANSDSYDAQALPATPILSGIFAYADSSGTKLLALGAVDDSSKIIGAVCAKGRTFHVRYDRTQSRREADNGRQLAVNFANEGGQVFRLDQGQAERDETCYLSSDSVLVANARAVRTIPHAPCTAADSTRIATAKKRQVEHCWRFAEATQGWYLVAAQFVRIGSDALASIVAMGDSAMLFQDFPGEYRGPDEGVWRVDDQGVFSLDGSDVLFVARFSDAFVMGLIWAGTEGESDALMVADSTDQFRQVVRSYRYWVP